MLRPLGFSPLQFMEDMNNKRMSPPPPNSSLRAILESNAKCKLKMKTKVYLLFVYHRLLLVKKECVFFHFVIFKELWFKLNRSKFC